MPIFPVPRVPIEVIGEETRTVWASSSSDIFARASEAWQHTDANREDVLVIRNQE